MDRPIESATAPPGTAIPRRKWLGSLLIGGTLAAVGGAVALLRTTGYETLPGAAPLRVLAAWQYAVVRAAARRIVAADRAEGVPSPDEVGVAEFVDGYLVEMRPSMRRDVFHLLRYIEQLAPIGSGFRRRFTELSPSEQDEVLIALEASRFDQLRAGFQAMKSLVMMGYYRDPRTFPILDYAGPFVMDPAERAP